MKQNRYFEKRDIRAVESPYDAAFDLAGRLRGMTHTTRVILFLLIGYFILSTIAFIFFMMGVFGGIIYLAFFSSEVEVLTVHLTYVAIAGLVVLEVLLVFAVLISFRSAEGLLDSFKFLGELRKNHDLLNRIYSFDWGKEMRAFHQSIHRAVRSVTDKVLPGKNGRKADAATTAGEANGDAAGGGAGGAAMAGVAGADPHGAPNGAYAQWDPAYAHWWASQHAGAPGSYTTAAPGQGLMALIHGASDHSKKVLDTSRTVMTFVIAMCLVVVFMNTMMVLYFGNAAIGSSVCGIGFYLAIFVLVWVVGTRFRFVRDRYSSIRYAMDQEPVKVPKGKDPLMRYAKFLTRQEAYKGLKDPKLWKREGSFHARLETKLGLIFVKGTRGPPRMKELEEFRGQVVSSAAGKTIDRAVILYKERHDKDLEDAVYNDVINRPIVVGDEVCNIQLVAEGVDGTYDFAPVMSFQAPSKPYWEEMLPFGEDK